MEYELAINNGTIIDGTGRQRFRGDIGIQDGRIQAVTSGSTLLGRRAIDATGLMVAPGFIDIHSHSDWVLPDVDHARILEPFVIQGVTTIVGGNCGFSPSPIWERAQRVVSQNSMFLSHKELKYEWRSTSEYLDFLQRSGVYFNTAVLTGHGTLRALAVGNSSRKLSDEEVNKLRHILKRSMNEGGYGLSMGLAYVPGIFADDREITGLLRTVAEAGGIWTFHGHTYSWTSPFYCPKYVGTPHNIRDLRRLLRLSLQAGARTNVSHLIFKGRRTWKTYPLALAAIERAAEKGLDVAFDALPYHWGNSLINILFPAWFLDGFNDNIQNPVRVRKVKREVRRTESLIGRRFDDIYLLWGGSDELAVHEGSSLAQIGARMGIDEVNASIIVARESGGRAKILTASYSGEEGGYEEPLFQVLSHPLCSFELDSILTDSIGPQNPASYGAFPRVLGRFCRDLRLFTLEDAVHRMTDFSARRIGLKGTGRVAEGYWADLVIFDDMTIADNTTLLTPNARPTGIEAVLISGKIVVENGKVVSEGKHGRVLRKT